MILDYTLVDEDARGPVPGIDEDRVVRSIDRVNDESVGSSVQVEPEE